MAMQTPTVVLDPGHGGQARVGGSSPNNATGPNGLLEKDLTLDVARRVSAILGGRANVILTRADDSNRSLGDRARVGHDANADVFLSIHFNGWTSPAVDGSEAWVASGTNGGSHGLARSVLDRVLAVTHAPDRGVREADLGVLLPARQGAHSAAALIEVAFLTNPDEASRLTHDEYRQALAQAIADGIAARLPTALPATGMAVDAMAYPACTPSGLNQSLTKSARAYAEPLYDTGEHVMAGGDLYPDQLWVGQSPGVAFSYGELIGMADLYESVDQMMNTDAAELTHIKALTDRNTAFYQGGKANPALDVSNNDWEQATGGRYLKLAQENYEHFAPNTLFREAGALVAADKHGNHKSEWEKYHQRAIEEAQKMALAPENQNRSYIPVWPLIINGFGDHFLTDAFASGHLINKDVMIWFFQTNFYSGGSLNSAGDDFFERVADEAFVGDVAAKFSVLETVDYPVCAFGWCLKWHPNINSKSRFKSLLTAAAAAEPVKVANFAVKALHDKLNKDGIEVINGAGDGPWTLNGDGYLNQTTLAIMRKAVKQSVDNINDPSILASNLNFGTYFDRVWRYVPRLTTTSAPQLESMVREYTDPKSTVLSTAAAEVIRGQVDTMIQVLLSQGKLQRA
jgi:N-acetylmuramoyl-L-alanine amidase